MLKTNKQALSRCCALGHRNKADRAGEASLAFSCHGAALASWEGERDTVWVTSKAAFQQRLHSGGASLVAELVKNLPATQETWLDSWVRKIPWRGKGNPFQYSCLENSMDRWAWWATVHGVAKSPPRLSKRGERKPRMRLTPLGA